jgi:hypothetical protein
MGEICTMKWAIITSKNEGVGSILITFGPFHSVIYTLGKG